jgi:hypothetical protein
MSISVQIIELNKVSGFDNRLKITGAKDEAEAKEAVHFWCEENNCLCAGITLSEAGYFIADVCSDDYK